MFCGGGVVAWRGMAARQKRTRHVARCARVAAWRGVASNNGGGARENYLARRARLGISW